jgi:hypothetical protein
MSQGSVFFPKSILPLMLVHKGMRCVLQSSCWNQDRCALIHHRRPAVMWTHPKRRGVISRLQVKNRLGPQKECTSCIPPETHRYKEEGQNRNPLEYRARLPHSSILNSVCSPDPSSPRVLTSLSQGFRGAIPSQHHPSHLVLMLL